ncbi:MAG: hypothetical protein FJ295_12390 [Planctomycetes bacterium]|nr:hypothetical protein [Planctomycetota bacterium]
MALFPFLAVLICTMGSLIVLLVMILHQARVHAAMVSSPAVWDSGTNEDPEELEARAQREQLQQAVSKLEELRAVQARQSAEARLALGHLEQHLRDLEREGERLNAQRRELIANQSETRETDDELKQRIQEIEGKIRLTREELEQARRDAKGKRKSFAVIPYVGPNGTRRRPIYIECALEGIMLHPENILLQEPDFAGPMGPGNPLDACLRAVREYLLSRDGTSEEGEPYPLLIVRPSGIYAYEQARNAMKSWENEFGYELIDDETPLQFPPADTELEKILIKTLRDARDRQSLLAAAMPSRFKGESAGMVASPGGGFVTQGGANGGARVGGASPGSAASASVAARGNGQRGIGNGSPGNPVQDRASAAAGIDAARPRTAAGGGNGSSGGSGGKPDADPDRGQGDAAEGSSNPNDRRAKTKAGLQANSAARRATGSSAQGSADAEGTGHSAAAASTSAGGTGSSFGNSVYSVAQSKGTDWALPPKSINSTGITRPIRVRLFQDRIVLVPERGERQKSTTISLHDAPMRAQIEPLVTAVWNYTETWGLAVANGYWKPVLRVEVAPGADARFEEFRTLMSGSGLDVERKN